MSTKTIYGNVNADGSIHSGSGDFQVIPEGTNGVYTLIFKQSFSSIPTVILTQKYSNSPSNWTDFPSDGGDTRDNAVLIAVNQDKAKLKTGDSTGGGTDRDFGFMATGGA